MDSVRKLFVCFPTPTLNSIARCVAALSLGTVLFCGGFSHTARASTTTCTTGALPTGDGGDLIVNTGTCTVGAGKYLYGNVNIYGGGSLVFTDAKIDFWAKSILVEASGSLIAGTTAAPIGTAGGVVIFHLYGKDQGTAGKGGQGIICQSPGGTCGVPSSIWTSNTMSTMNPSSCTTSQLPGGVTDCFYQYEPLVFDGGGTTPGYFGYKVLAVSYGGTLHLFGKKGATYTTLLPSNSGTSWARLNSPLAAGGSSLVLDRAVNWVPGDQIVVTTTDYLPGHSEQLTIASVSVSKGVTAITTSNAAQYPHNGSTFSLSGVPKGIGPDPDPLLPSSSARTVETRAAVALLTRNIQIVSEGDSLEKPFPSQTATPSYYFGGHTLVRQGFQSFQVQGVEFYHLGQGGRIMHYPVHFHMARTVPANTFVADSSVHDSMTRWYTLHATGGVTLQRNVGYLSIGNGYYLEDGTETSNKLYANIGIFARAAVQNDENPRNVPGILAGTYTQTNTDLVPFHTDVDHPTVFWMMNGWNDFEYNMAAGAGTCGMCYWLTPGGNSGMSRYEYWGTGYPAEQQMTQTSPGNDNYARAGTSPLQKFVGNSCVSAQNSLITVGNTAPCFGVVANSDSGAPIMTVVPNPLAPTPPTPPSTTLSPQADAYYPKINSSGYRTPTLCPSGQNCAAVPTCANGQEANCAVTTIDHYTTSYNWAQTNLSAIWLRSQWYLLSNSAITDVQNGGLTFVSGGGYSYSDEIPGYWALAHKDVFIGNTQTGNPFALNAGPFNPSSGVTCAKRTDNGAVNASFCMNANQGISMSLDNFALNQRLFNIYDGPSFEDSNAYLNITPTTLTGCTPGGGLACQESGWMYGNSQGMPLDPNGGTAQCYLPNAAIGWKQPNAFYYPPAFHSSNLYFGNVTIRHFVIEPLFSPGTYNTDTTLSGQRYCTPNSALFTGFTDIDRQTELNDDDGSLTGLVNTISVNKDHFFDAPVETTECESDIANNLPPTCDPSSPLCGTAKTSPYDYVSTVVYPGCGTGCDQSVWATGCENFQCFGVPLYREDSNPNQDKTKPAFIRMAGQSTGQRSSLTVNNATYYIDSAVSAATQAPWCTNNNGGISCTTQPNVYPGRPELLHLPAVCQTDHDADLPDVRWSGFRSEQSLAAVGDASQSGERPGNVYYGYQHYLGLLCRQERGVPLVLQLSEWGSDGEHEHELLRFPDQLQRGDRRQVHAAELLQLERFQQELRLRP